MTGRAVDVEFRLQYAQPEVVDAYVTNLETDPALNFQGKEGWNHIIAQPKM